MRVYTQCEGAHGDQKVALDSLELDLQAVVSLPVLVMGHKLQSFARSATALNCRAIFLVATDYFFNKPKHWQVSVNESSHVSKEEADILGYSWRET